MRTAIVLGCALLHFATPAAGIEGISTVLGKTLFEADNLGSNAMSCATCHPNGQGLEEIDRLDGAKLKAAINGCIRDSLQGQPLATEAQELESMAQYLRTLANR